MNRKLRTAQEGYWFWTSINKHNPTRQSTHLPYYSTYHSEKESETISLTEKAVSS